MLQLQALPPVSLLHRLHQITRSIYASLEEKNVHAAIVREFCKALEGDCAGLLLYDLETQTVAVAAAFCERSFPVDWVSEAPVGLTLRLGTESESEHPPTWQTPWVIQDVDTAHLPEAERLLLQTAKMHSLLMIPIVDQAQLVGTVYVGQVTSCRLWTPEEIDLAQLAAEQTAIALRHAAQFRETQQQTQREQALNRIAQRIRTSLDLDTTLNTALTELLELSKAEVFAFAAPVAAQPATLRVTHCLKRTSQASGQQPNRFEDLKWRYLTQPNVNIAIGTELSLDSCGPHISDRLISTTVFAIANTQSTDLEKPGQLYLQSQKIGAWLSVAIWSSEKLLGYLIALRPQPHDWSQDEQVAVEVIANQLAIAISHRQLYAKSQHQAQKAQKQAQKLAQTIQQLYETQAQLVQSEKMSSLGQLVAGIAHEINNPVNFIYANIPYITEYSDELLKLVNLYEAHYPDAHQLRSDHPLDLEFVQTDLHKILNSIQTGAERIRSLVLTLRNFSRLDEAEGKRVNLHEGIDSALLLLKHRLKSHNRIIRRYGDIPLVDSYPGQLNQVFMNILSNAIEAMNSDQVTLAGAEAAHQLTITTCLVPAASGDLVQVRIRDTGPGIPPEHRHRVFDPFFTTKPVGSGTGLGLSISYRIVVHKHQGKLWFETELGQGTEFIIELPITREKFEPDTSPIQDDLVSLELAPAPNQI